MTRRAPIALALLAALVACGDRPGPDAAPVERPPELVIPLDEAQVALIQGLSPLPPPPADPTNAYADDPGARAFGEALFHEPGLSSDGRVSCATCHDPQHGFSVTVPFASGLEPTRRHPPTLWNVAHHRWFHWDGRSDTLWGQALAPMEHPGEMGGSRLEVVRRVVEDPELARHYRAVFGPLPDLAGLPAGPARPLPEGEADAAAAAWASFEPERREAIDRAFVNIGKALAAFQTGLVSGTAPFDVFVEGLRENDGAKIAALSPSAQRGLALFIGRADCILCHHGPAFTDREFHNIGLDAGDSAPDLGRWEGIARLRASAFTGAGAYSDAPDHAVNDKTRFLAQRPNNMGEFKTPSLREVAMTGPYMHDGRFYSLERVVRFYSDLDEEPVFGHREESLKQLHLTEEEIFDLVAFLESLTSIDRERQVGR